VCIPHTLPEKTLRNWKAGAGTGPGEKTGKTLKYIQILIAVDAVRGSPPGFLRTDVLLCQRKSFGKGGKMP